MVNNMVNKRKTHAPHPHIHTPHPTTLTITTYIGSLAGVDLLHIPLNIPQHIVVVQVCRQVLHHIMAVTHVDQRTCIRKLGLHQKLLGLFRRVVGRLSSDSLDLLELLGLGSRLYVLVVHLWVLTKGDVGAEVKVEAVVGFERLEELDDFLSGELIGVFLGHLDDDLQVLLQVGGQQLLGGGGATWVCGDGGRGGGVKCCNSANSTPCHVKYT